MCAVRDFTDESMNHLPRLQLRTAIIIRQLSDRFGFCCHFWGTQVRQMLKIPQKLSATWIFRTTEWKKCTRQPGATYQPSSTFGSSWNTAAYAKNTGLYTISEPEGGVPVPVWKSPQLWGWTWSHHAHVEFKQQLSAKRHSLLGGAHNTLIRFNKQNQYTLLLTGPEYQSGNWKQIPSRLRCTDGPPLRLKSQAIWSNALLECRGCPTRGWFAVHSLWTCPKRTKRADGIGALMINYTHLMQHVSIYDVEVISSKSASK